MYNTLQILTLRNVGRRCMPAVARQQAILGTFTTTTILYAHSINYTMPLIQLITLL